MTILIYHLEQVNDRIKMVERGRFDNGKVTGKINISQITKEEVINEFNRGYYRTSEI